MRTDTLEHWRAYLPATYGTVENPEEFSTLLGKQADAEIEDRYLGYAGPDVPGESAEDKQARLTQAMSRAAEEVFAELVTRARPARASRTRRTRFPRELARATSACQTEVAVNWGSRAACRRPCSRR
jgi:hypothetical protein